MVEIMEVEVEEAEEVVEDVVEEPNDVKYIICRLEKERDPDPDEYFKCEPKSSTIKTSCQFLGYQSKA